MIFAIAFASLISTPLQVKVLLGNKPMPQQVIEFFQFKNGDEHSSLQKKTDSAGHVSFDVNTKEDVQIVFRTIYKNLQYLSDPYFSQTLPKEGVVIQVYDTVAESPEVFVEDLRLFISATREEIKIEQDILAHNASHFSVTGKESKGAYEVLRFSLPETSHDLRFTNGFSQEDTRFENDDIISNRPILPGLWSYGLKYSLERGVLSSNITLKTSLPVRQLSISSDIEGLNLSGQGFVQGPSKYFKGKMFPTWTAPIKDLKNISFKASGLPLKFREAHLVFSISFILLLAFVFILTRQKEVSSEIDKTAILKDLVVLKRMKEKNLISEAEFVERRLQSLLKLQDFYS